MAGFEELNFMVIVPRGSGECREFEVTACSLDNGEKLKKRIEKLCGIPSDDMELFVKNIDNEEDQRQKWVYEDATLMQQGVHDGAVITVGVHGMKTGEQHDEDGEIPGDHVNNSICTKGEASYYHAHSRKPELPEANRIVSGGSPRKLGETSELLQEPKNFKQRLQESEEGHSRPERPIVNYSWGDEKDVIKIYITQDSEPAAIAAAQDGKKNEVEVKWQPRSLTVRVHAEKHDLVLELEKVYYEIIPEECKLRISPGKRITLSLKKKEAYTWLKLLKPD